MPERGLGLLDQPRDVVLTADVARHAVDRAERRELGRRRSDLALVVPAEHDAAPLLEEPADGRLPDAAAPAGDEHRLVRQTAQRVTSIGAVARAVRTRYHAGHARDGGRRGTGQQGRPPSRGLAA